jgi:hypothetical protein
MAAGGFDEPIVDRDAVLARAVRLLWLERHALRCCVCRRVLGEVGGFGGGLYYCRRDAGTLDLARGTGGPA